jgi:hypothetical protein
MSHGKSRRIQVVVEQDLLRKFPHLAKLSEWIEFDRLNAFILAIEKRPEKMKVTVINNALRISAKEMIVSGRLDYLGLERPSDELNDLCDVIRDQTNRDPRREVYYSRKSSVFRELGEEAMITPNTLYIRKSRGRHPLDLVSTEEVMARRELADRRWNKRAFKGKRKASKDEKDSLDKEVKDYFFSEKK